MIGSLNVRDFGAVGDGITDDTAAFTSCYDALPFDGATRQVGGGIYVPAGVYVINDWTWGTNGKTVHLQGDYGLTYLLPQGDAWAIITPNTTVFPRAEWARHSIRDVCIIGEGSGNGIAHGTQAGIDYERIRLINLKIGVHMNSSSYGDMFNSVFRGNDIGLLVGARTGAVQDPDTVLAFDPPPLLTNNANKQFRHLTFNSNRCGIVFDAEITGAIRQRFEHISIEGSKVGIVVLQPSDPAPTIELEFDRGHLEGNGVTGQQEVTTPLLGHQIEQGDVTAYHGRIGIMSFQTVTTARAYGQATIDINDGNLWIPVGDTLYTKNVTSSRRAWGVGRGAIYDQSYNLVLPSAIGATTAWARPVTHGNRIPFAGTIMSIDGAHYEMPDGVTSFGLGGAGITPRFGLTGGVFGRHQEITMPSESDFGYAVDLASIAQLVAGKLYMMTLTIKSDLIGAEVWINASTIFQAQITIDDHYRTYVWASIYDGSKADFIMNFKNEATYLISAWTICECESSLQAQALVEALAHTEFAP